MSAERKQSGLAHSYTEFVPETTTGEVPTDPSFKAFSDNMRTVWDGEPDASTEAQRGLGTRDPRGFFNGLEEHEFTFVYDLQQWYVDDTGDIQDPGGVAMKDTGDNDIAETHTVVSKEEHVSGGVAGNGRYIITVGKGGHVSALTVPFETESGLPVPQEISYRFEKVREYSISQPESAGELLTVRSTDDADTTQSLQLESDDGGTTEGVPLDGTTDATTTSEFSSLAGAELDAEAVGDVVVENSSGDELLRIEGQGSYEDIEGDLGVPVIGSGSHAGSIGSDYIRFREDILEYTGGTRIAPEISSGELSIDNGVSSTGRDRSVRQSIDVGDRQTTLSASLAGPKPTVDQMVDYLTENAETIDWIPNTASSHTLSLDSARLITPGSIGRESDTAKVIVESEWESEGLTVT